MSGLHYFSKINTVEIENALGIKMEKPRMLALEPPLAEFVFSYKSTDVFYTVAMNYDDANSMSNVKKLLEKAIADIENGDVNQG